MIPCQRIQPFISHKAMCGLFVVPENLRVSLEDVDTTVEIVPEHDSPGFVHTEPKPILIPPTLNRRSTSDSSWEFLSPSNS